MTIMIDCDDVLIDLLAVWLDRLNKYCGTKYTTEDIRCWELENYFPDLTADELIAPLIDLSLWDDVEPNEGAETALYYLNNKYDVYVATATDYRNFTHKVDAVFKRLFPYFSVDRVIRCNNKRLLNCDVIIDDNIENLKGHPGLKLLFSRSHNSIIPEDDLLKYDIIRVSNWNDVIKIIEEN